MCLGGDAWAMDGGGKVFYTLYAWRYSVIFAPSGEKKKRKKLSLAVSIFVPNIPVNCCHGEFRAINSQKLLPINNTLC